MNIGVIGLGLIGGSFALAAKKHLGSRAYMGKIKIQITLKKLSPWVLLIHLTV